jgi:uncharacterized membrane protein YbjE (DUF340 family)
MGITVMYTVRRLLVTTIAMLALLWSAQAQQASGGTSLDTHLPIVLGADATPTATATKVMTRPAIQVS